MTMKKLITLLVIFLAFTSKAQDIYTDTRFLGEIPQFQNGNGEYYRFSPFGSAVGINNTLYFRFGSFSAPAIHIEYDKPKQLISGEEGLRKIFSRNSTYSVRLSDGILPSVANTFEAAMQRCGFKMVKSNAGKPADYIIEIGNLRFSDPLMWTDLHGIELKGDFSPFYVEAYKEIFSEEKYARKAPEIHSSKWDKETKKLSTKGIYKGYKHSNLIGYGTQFIDMQSILSGKEYIEALKRLTQYNSLLQLSKDQIYNEFKEAECFIHNKNVISFICTFTNAKTGEIIGSIHCGYQDGAFSLASSDYKFTTFSLEYWCESNRDAVRNSSKQFSGYKFYDNSLEWKSDWHNERSSNLTGYTPYTICLLNTLSILMPSTAEIPGAKKLTNGEAFKISDKKIVENTTSSTSSRYTYRGNGGTDYYRFFNRSYWHGTGAGQSNTSTNSTTTYVDAEFLKPTDFTGYYSPLSKVLIDTINKIKTAG